MTKSKNNHMFFKLNLINFFECLKQDFLLLNQGLKRFEIDWLTTV